MSRPVRVAVEQASDTLRRAGVPSPAADARALVAYALDVPLARLAGQPPLDGAAEARLAGLVARRAAREPLQHLTGLAGFHRIDVAVGPGAFVPRPETELLVEHVLAAGLPAHAVVVDLCTGPGTVAAALAAALPYARVHAVDREAPALAWAARTLDRLGLAERVTVHCAAVADVPDLLGELAGRVDAVTANPPYLPDSWVELLDPEVACYDPPAALFGGADGLSVVREVLPVAAVLLRTGGVLAVEHADTQAAAVTALLRDAGGWQDIMDHRDLAGRDRYATAVRVRGAGG